MEQGVSIPKCVGVIVDGNRRWAKLRGDAPGEGHVAGRKKFREFVEWAANAGVKAVIAYTFSTENWNRPTEEVATLMALLYSVLRDDLVEMKEKGFRVRIIGDRSRFPAELQTLFAKAESETSQNSGMIVGLLLSYGGRDEIVAAARELLRKGVDPEALTKEQFEKELWTAGIPDPDMIIRTSGEKRLSNYLPWQSAYSELFFTETLWPDFTQVEFLKMIEEFGERDRRFGK